MIRDTPPEKGQPVWYVQGRLKRSEATFRAGRGGRWFYVTGHRKFTSLRSQAERFTERHAQAAADCYRDEMTTHEFKVIGGGRT